MIQGDHEDAPGQIELNFGFDRAEQTADNLSTFRQICKQVGRELDAFPCFMPKPFMGVSANGCHHNISLWRGDENAFMPDTKDLQKPSRGLYAIGGIMEHLAALTAVTVDRQLVPPPVGHRLLGARLRGLGLPEPDDRAARLGPGRFEYRSVDSAVNPYLSLAGLIAAMGTASSGSSTRRARGAEHLRGDGGRQAGQADPDDLRRGARRARGRRRRQVRCPAICTVCSCTTSATSGSGTAPTSATGTSPSTSTSFRRERARHVRNCRDHLSGRHPRDRARHDPDAPVDEAPGPRLDRLRALRPHDHQLVMRYKLADANTPRDFEFSDRLDRHQDQVIRRLKAMAPTSTTSRRRRSTPTASPSRFRTAT